jgi:hypothetical protein
MISLGFWLTLLGWVISAVIPALAQTAVEVRLLTPVSSYASKSGEEIEALLATPLCANSIQMVPPGAIVRGRIDHVHKVGVGLIHETALLDLKFDEIRFPDGRRYPLEARLTGVDNARERVDAHGAIHGIRATAAPSNRASQRLAFAALDNPWLMIPAFTVQSALFPFPDPEIFYSEGTELYLQVRFRDALAGLRPCTYPGPPPSPERAELRRLVAGLPAWSYSKRQRQPKDVVGLVFVGSADEVQRAFKAAGWSDALGTSVGTRITAIRAIAANSGYSRAPMTTLLLDGAEPDLSFQKSLNTFAKRHHLRVWIRPEEWQGRAVWASSATRDIAATFSVRPFGFTHQIETQVDIERDKVVSDLAFTGCVDSVSYVPRALHYRAGPEYRRGVNTDSRVAVIELNACPSPPRGPVAETASPRPGAFVRGTRRALLTARNRLIRFNIYWQSADAARLVWMTLRNWRQSIEDERRARAAGALELPSDPPLEPALLSEPPALIPLDAELPEIPGLDAAPEAVVAASVRSD